MTSHKNLSSIIEDKIGRVLIGDDILIGVETVKVVAHDYIEPHAQGYKGMTYESMRRHVKRKFPTIEDEEFDRVLELVMSNGFLTSKGHYQTKTRNKHFEIPTHYRKVFQLQ